MPPHWKISKDIVTGTTKFGSALEQIFTKKQCSPNLSTTQLRLLRELKTKNRFVIVKADKNLGPCIIETDAYIRYAINDHLHCRLTYQRLSLQSAKERMQEVQKNLKRFLSKYKDEHPNEL